MHGAPGGLSWTGSCSRLAAGVSNSRYAGRLPVSSSRSTALLALLGSKHLNPESFSASRIPGIPSPSTFCLQALVAVVWGPVHSGVEPIPGCVALSVSVRVATAYRNRQFCRPRIRSCSNCSSGSICPRRRRAEAVSVLTVLIARAMRNADRVENDGARDE